MAFEYLGNSSVPVAGPVDVIDLDTPGGRAYAAQVYLDDLDGDVIHVEIEVDFDPGTGVWRSVWDSGEITVAPSTIGNEAVPGLTVPPFPVANDSRMVVTLVSGTGGNFMWDLFGL